MIQSKVLASIFFAAGGALLLTTGLVAWSGFNHWLAADHLRTSVGKSLAGDRDGARAAGRRAYEILPGEPAAALAAADLGVSANADSLLAIARHATPSERATIAAAVGVALGRPPEGLDPDASDLVLLQAIAARSPGPAKLDKDHPPHLAVLAAWNASRLSAAWAARSRTDVFEAASALLTIAPRHPQADELTLLCAALGPEEPTKAKLIAAAAGIEDVDRRGKLGSHLVAMAPERTSLRMLLPGGGDPAAGAAAALQRQVASGKANPTGINEGLVIACLQAGKADLADEVLAAMPDTAKRAELNRLPDLLDGGAFANDLPRATTPVVAGDTLAFHLSNSAGALPTKAITVKIGTLQVPADQIRRIGTLVSVPIKNRGSQDVDIRYDGKPVFAANLSL